MYRIDEESGELCETVTTEPIAADARLDNGDQGWTSPQAYLDELDPEEVSEQERLALVESYKQRLELAKLKIIAGILDLPLGTLTQRDKAYQLKLAQERSRKLSRWLALTALLTVLATGAGALAWYQRSLAEERRIAAETSQINESKARAGAEQLIYSMVFDLKQKLQPLGKLELLDEISDASETYFEELPSVARGELDFLNRLQLKLNRAEILRAVGKLEEARDLLISAIGKAENAPPGPSKLALDPSRSRQRTLMSMYIELGLAHRDLEELELAYAALDKVRVIFDAVDDRSFENYYGWQPVAAALHNQGLIDLKRQSPAGAVEKFSGALEILRELGTREPRRGKIRIDMAANLTRLGMALHYQSKDTEAAQAVSEAMSIRQKLVDLNPENLELLEDLAKTYDIALGLSVVLPVAAVSLEEQVIGIRKRLLARDPLNIGYIEGLSSAYSEAALARFNQGDSTGTVELMKKARANHGQLLQRDSENREWRGDYATLCFNLAAALENARRVTEALPYCEEAMQHVRDLVAASPNHVEWTSLLARCHVVASRLCVMEEDLDDARRHSKGAFQMFARLQSTGQLHAQDRSFYASALAEAELYERNDGNVDRAEELRKEVNQLRPVESGKEPVDFNPLSLEGDVAALFEAGDVEQAHANLTDLYKLKRLELESRTMYVLLDPATAWKYLDGGASPPPESGWTGLEFDDSHWKSGRQQLGFGDPEDVTILQRGTKGLSYYFRHTFEVAERDADKAVGVAAIADDGLILYLNGEEVARSNLPEGEVAHDTPALRALDRPRETQETGFLLKQTLKPGRNIIAAEIHNASPQSSDVSFHLILTLRDLLDLPAGETGLEQLFGEGWRTIPKPLRERLFRELAEDGATKP